MAWDKTWEKIFSNNEWGKYPAESLIRFIARNFYKVNNRESIKILEVGCGPGANLWYMNREGFTVYGIDGSETAIKKAEKRLKEDIWDGKGNYSLQVGDIISLPFEDNFFDAVIDCEVTYANKYTEAKKMFAEMYRVVREGGIMYTRMFAEGTYGLTTDGKAKVGPMAGKGYARMTAKEELSDLIGAWQINSIDLSMYTLDGVDNQHWIKEWIVTARK